MSGLRRDIGRSALLAAFLAAPAQGVLPSTWTAADANAAGGLNAAGEAAALSPQFIQAGARAYAVWHEDGRIRAAVYNGDDGAPGWSPIDNGAGLNKDSGRRAEAPALAAVGPVLYAAWHEFNGSAYQVRAAAYDGASWTFADGGGAAGLNASPRLNALNPHLAVVAGKLYAVWQESNGSRRRVRAAVKAGAGWSLIDGGGLDAGGAGEDALTPQLSVFGAKLYASWQESAAGLFTARVAVYNGEDSSPAWTAVSGTGLNAGSSCRGEPVRLAASSATLYAAWCEEGPGGRRVRAALYNGVDAGPSWSFIDGGGFGGPAGEDRSMVQLWVYRGNLHLSYQQSAAGATVVRAALYEGGNAWPFIDGGGLNRDPLRSGAFPAFGVYRAGLYAIWTEASGSSSWIRLARAHHAAVGARAAVVLDTSLTVVWDSVGAPMGYVLEASTAPDFTGVVARQSTVDREAAALTLSGLSPLTTYHVRVGAVYSGQTLFAPALTAPTLALRPADDSSSIRAVVASPEAGKSVGGGRLLVLAEVLRGEAAVSGILFQYRRPGGPWADMPAARAEYPNPARQTPYWIYWDLSDPAAYPAGDYELRARAASADAVDEQAPVAAVRLDRADPDIDGSALGPDSVQVRQRLSNLSTSVVSAAAPAGGLLTEVTMPAGALDAATTTLRLVVNPPGVPPAPGLEAAGVFREITLENGQTRFAGGRMATLVLGYADADSDGFVDGTAIKTDRLRAYSYDPASASWTRDFDSVVDTRQKTVTARTPHFTLFGLFAPAAADLSAVRVYPVPFVPGDGSDDNGKPYSAGDATSGILFDNLTSDASVTVYSLLGARVWRGPAPGAGGLLRWDGRNDDGRDAATGSYFAVIESPATGGRALRRLAIVR